MIYVLADFGLVTLPFLHSPRTVVLCAHVRSTHRMTTLHRSSCTTAVL